MRKNDDDRRASSVAESIRCAPRRMMTLSHLPLFPPLPPRKKKKKTSIASCQQIRHSRNGVGDTYVTQASFVSDVSLPIAPLGMSTLPWSSARELMDDVAQAAPALAAAAASTATFTVTARAARSAAFLVGVSCATPVVGAMWGVCTTAGASVLAGQAARAALQFPYQNSANGGGFDLRRWSGPGGGVATSSGVSGYGATAWRAWGIGSRRSRDQPWDEREATADAMIGSMLYALLGRGVRSTLPSDVSHPGALARMSMPANGAHYATVRGGGSGAGT